METPGYRDRLDHWRIRGSMSRKGNPYDNAKAESFMKTLKHEEVLRVDYLDLRDLQDRLPKFLEERYNRRRLHSSLGYPQTNSSNNTPDARSVHERRAVHPEGAHSRSLVQLCW
jgi:transposase InsO family protein